MKILLLGHSIIDHFAEDASDMSKPGGIFYSVLGMYSIAKHEDEIFLLTSCNSRSFHLFEKIYSKTNMCFSELFEEMPEVILKTSVQGEREETYKNISSRLGTEKIDNWNMFDGILINMITGFDISPGQILAIWKNYKGKIYLDVHTLSRGVDENMKRNFRPVPEIEKWFACVDIIQCNETELKTITKSSNEAECAREVLKGGPEILIVTKGEKGSSAYLFEDENLRCINFNAVEINAVNKIGCGDIFGAVFFYSYISKKDVAYSLDAANKAGAIAASINYLTNLSKIEFDDKQ